MDAGDSKKRKTQASVCPVRFLETHANQETVQIEIPKRKYTQWNDVNFAKKSRIFCKTRKESRDTARSVWTEEETEVL